MIGQERLIEQLKSYSYKSFPRSLMLVGPKGSGKHTLAEEIGNMLNLTITDITDNLSLDTIELINRQLSPYLYLIDMSKLNERKQNIILKFIEEPTNNTHLILLVDNKNKLLETITNRCVVYELAPYPRDVLRTFAETKDEQVINLMLQVCTTPGQIKTASFFDIKGIFDLASKLVNQIDKLTYAQVIEMVDLFNYKDEYDKFDIDIFFNTLRLLLVTFYKKYNEKRLLDMYYYTNDKLSILKDQRVKKDIFMLNYFTGFYKRFRG